MLSPQRLETLLSLVSSLELYDVVPIADLARQLDVAENELAADLSLLEYTGIPPFGGGDLVPIEIADGCLCVTGAMPLPAKPLRLREEEAAALSLALSIAGFTDNDPLLQQLGSALANDFDADQLHALLHTVRGRHNPHVFRDLSAALRDGQAVQLDYTKDGITTSLREVAPLLLFVERDQWYLRATDTQSSKERTFRVDRIRGVIPVGTLSDRRSVGVHITDGKATQNTAKPSLHSGSQSMPTATPTSLDLSDADTCRIRFCPVKAFRPERWPQARLRARGADWIEIDLPVVSDDWVAHRVVACHGQATVRFPAELRTIVHQQAKELLSELSTRTPTAP